MGKKLGSIFLVIFLFLATVSPVLASGNSGIITGKITDTEGSPLPGAFVYVDSPALLAIHGYVTQDTGKIKFYNLPPGKYRISVEMPGFKTVHIEDITIRSGVTLYFPIKLEVSTVEEETTIPLSTPTVDLRTIKTAAVFDQNLIIHLPFERDFQKIIMSAPGIIQDFRFPQLTMVNHGSTATENLFFLDGVNINDPDGMQLLIPTNFDLIEEIETITAGFTAEKGSPGGGSINIITKSGKNGVTGGISLHHTNKGFINSLRTDEELTDLGVSPAPADRRLWDVSLSLGGSLLEDNLWFYGNASFLSQSKTTPFIPWVDPTGKEHEEYNWGNTQKIGSFKLSSRFVPQLKVTGLFYYEDRDRTNHNSLLDWNVTEEATFILKNEKSYLGNIILNYSLDQNTFTDIQLGYAYNETPYLLAEEIKSNPQYYDEASGHLWGTAAFNNVVSRKRFQIKVDLTHFEDSFFGIDHKFRIGAEYEYSTGEWEGWKQDNLRIHYNNSNPYFFGMIKSPSTENVVGKGKISFLNISDLAIIVNPKVESRRLSFYAQDSATIGGRLTFFLGLRFDRLMTSQPGFTKAPAGNVVSLEIGEELIKPLIDINPYSSNTLFEWDNMIVLNALSPRVGFTLDLFGNSKGIFKASFSRYPEYLRLHHLSPINPYSVNRSHQFFWYDENMDGGVDINDSFMLYPEDYRIYLEDTYKERVSPKIKLPYTEEIILGLHQELLKGFSIKINYIRKVQKNILENVLFSPDQNKDWYTTELDTQNWWIPFETIIPETDTLPEKSVTLYFMSSENAPLTFDRLKNVPELTRKYQSIEFSFEKRMSNNWQLLGSLVYSETTGNINQDIISSSGFSSAADSPNYFVNFPEDSKLNFDRPLVLKLMGTYRFPYDFYLSFYFSHMSGNPWIRSVTVIPPSSWIEENQVYGLPTEVLLETPGTHRNDTYSNLDIRVEKDFMLSAQRKLSFYVDVLNIIGHEYNILNRNDGGYWFPEEEMTTEGIRILSPIYDRVTSLLRDRVFKLTIQYTF